MTKLPNIAVDKLIVADNFIDFIKSVREFCELVENNETENSLLFLQSTQIHLLALYSSGQNLQAVELKHNESFVDLLTKEDSQKILSCLSDKLDKNRYYWHLFDPINEKETEPVCGDLLDDLGDIYKDLKNAMLLFDKGTTAEIESAAWDFKWDFDNHWGRHCINAIYALHYFIQHAT